MQLLQRLYLVKRRAPLLAFLVVYLDIERPDLSVMGKDDIVGAQRKQRGGALRVAGNHGGESARMSTEGASDAVGHIGVAAGGIDDQRNPLAGHLIASSEEG